MKKRKIHCYKDLKQASIAIIVIAFFGTKIVGVILIAFIILLLGLGLSNTIILDKGYLIRKNIFGNYNISTSDIKEIILLPIGPYLSPFRFQIVLNNNEKKILKIEYLEDVKTIVTYVEQECIVFKNQHPTLNEFALTWLNLMIQV